MNEKIAKQPLKLSRSREKPQRAFAIDSGVHKYLMVSSAPIKSEKLQQQHEAHHSITNHQRQGQVQPTTIL